MPGVAYPRKSLNDSRFLWADIKPPNLATINSAVDDSLLVPRIRGTLSAAELHKTLEALKANRAQYVAQQLLLTCGLGSSADPGEIAGKVGDFYFVRATHVNTVMPRDRPDVMQDNSSGRVGSNEQRGGPSSTPLLVAARSRSGPGGAAFVATTARPPAPIPLPPLPATIPARSQGGPGGAAFVVAPIRPPAPAPLPPLPHNAINCRLTKPAEDGVQGRGKGDPHVHCAGA